MKWLFSLAFMFSSFLALSQISYQGELYLLDSIVKLQTFNGLSNIVKSKYYYNFDDKIVKIESDNYHLIYEYREDGYTETRFDKTTQINTRIYDYTLNKAGYTTDLKSYYNDENSTNTFELKQHDIYHRNDQNQIILHQKFFNIDSNLETLELYSEREYSYQEQILIKIERFQYDFAGNTTFYELYNYNYNNDGLIENSEVITNYVFPSDNKKELKFYQYNSDGTLKEQKIENYIGIDMDQLTDQLFITYEYSEDKIILESNRYNFDTETYELYERTERLPANNPFFTNESSESIIYGPNGNRRTIHQYFITEDEEGLFLTVRRDSRSFINNNLFNFIGSKMIYKKLETPILGYNSLMDVAIFPNPVLAGNPLKLECSTNSYNGLRIYSSDGKLIEDRSIIGNYNITVEAPMSAGDYFIQLNLNGTPRSKWLKIIAI